MTPNDDLSILSTAQVADMLGVSRRTLDRLEERGELPGKVQLSPRRVGWRKTAIQAWLSSRETKLAQ